MGTARWGMIGVVLAVGMLVGASSALAEPLLLDNFDSGSKPNALGGDFGSWDKDPNDPTQFCHISFDRDNAYGGTGYALRLDYDVDSPNPAYNGFWSKLNNLDVSARHALTFHIKGDVAKGYTTAIKLELKNDHEKGTYILKGLTDQWQQATIALSDFKGLTDLTKLTEFVIVFDDITASTKVGTCYLDDVAFE